MLFTAVFCVQPARNLHFTTRFSQTGAWTAKTTANNKKKQPKKQKTSRNNSAPVQQIAYYIKYQGQHAYSLCMNFGKKGEPTIHLGVLPTPHETPRWSLEATAAGHRRFPPKKTAAEFRDRSHLRVDVGRKVMGTWRQEVILWICGRWMNFCQHRDLKGSHKVMPIGNFGTSRLHERQRLLKFVGPCGKMVKWKQSKFLIIASDVWYH